jgi:hypothetical protein
MGDAPRVVAEGEVPFAVLADGRSIMARYRTVYKPQPLGSLTDPEQTQWTLSLDGVDFTVSSWLPIEDSWTRGDRSPYQAAVENGAYVVRYVCSSFHHLGSLIGPVTLTFDLPSMTVDMREQLTFDPD